MSAERRSPEEIRGDQARGITESALFLEAIEATKQHYFDRWLRSQTLEERERLSAECNALDSFLDFFRAVMRLGDVDKAERQAQEEEEKRLRYQAALERTQPGEADPRI